MIAFSVRYSGLICSDIPKRKLCSLEEDAVCVVPECYRREFVYPDGGFVSLYCEEYD